MPISSKPLFFLGHTVATRGALAALRATGQQPTEFLNRHQAGDWGAMSEPDQRSNVEALELGGRIFSAYALQDGTRLYVITEADRSVTTLLLPSEY